MAQIRAPNETPMEALVDAPDEEWLRSLVDRSNLFDRQVASAFQRGITVSDNTTSLVKEIDLVHGQSVTVANPLSVPIQGIFAIGCRGLTVGSDGKPNGGVYDLAIPDLQAKPSTSGDGSWVVQANYAIMPGETTGYVGEKIGPITRLRSNALGLSSGTAANVCTQPSITLTPGMWQLNATIGYTIANTTSVTGLNLSISATSATLSGNDTVAVPTNGEIRQRHATAANVMGNGVDFTQACPPVTCTVAPGATSILFLVASAAFTVSTLTCFGSMEAVRLQPYLTGRTGKVKLFFFGG